MLVWKCDICKKETHINPPTKVVVDENGVPETAFTRTQDPVTGDIKKVQVPKLEDLKPRTYIIRLGVGQENITKDVCKVCLDNKLLPLIQPLWDKLANIKSE